MIKVPRGIFFTVAQRRQAMEKMSTLHCYQMREGEDVITLIKNVNILMENVMHAGFYMNEAERVNLLSIKLSKSLSFLLMDKWSKEKVKRYADVM